MSKRNSHGSLSKGSHHNVPDSRRSDRDDRRDREDRKERDDRRDDQKEDEPSKKPKLAFGSKPPGKPPLKMSLMAPAKKGIQIKLGAQKPSAAVVKLQSASSAVSAAFNVDDDDEPEEMPPEARMRMRNIGRETPTSAGPNSFGKTKQGFCDNKKMFEKTMKKAMDGSIIQPPRPDSGSE